MAGVVVIFHPEPAAGAGPLERWVAGARREVADRHAAGFLAAGAAREDVRVVAGPPDGVPFGRRLRAFIEREQPDGLVVLGSGAIPLATAADRRAFLAVAAGDGPDVLTNNRYSADVVALARPDVLRALPDSISDNALPRWLAEIAGCAVAERRSGRLSIDVDGPLDIVLLGRRIGAGRLASPTDVDLAPVQAALDGLRAAAADPHAELLVAGRTSGSAIRWLERNVAARVRASVEERGLRSATLAATPSNIPPNRRPPRSLLGELLERDGPGAFGRLLASLADAAVIDSRVLLAHRFGADEAAWPPPEDRYAADLLLPDRIGDPWLRELTASAVAAPIPIVLGGHSLVGPGLRLAVGGGRRR